MKATTETKSAAGPAPTEAEEELARLLVIEQLLVKPFYKRLEAVTDEVAAARGLGNAYGAGNGLGVTVVPRKGRWVDFRPYEVKRTRVMDGPADKNTLTVADARAFGIEARLPDTANFQDHVDELLGICVAAAMTGGREQQPAD
jgi:hypothetical protein